MRILKAAVLGGAMLVTVQTASADVRLSIQNGRVSLVAKDATARQILTEWARIGQTRIVNVERVPGGPLTIELTEMPEHQALDILLRAASGYVLAPRAVPATNLSQYDRIVVMPTSVAPRAAATPAPVFQQPQLPPQFDDDEERPTPSPALAPPRGPLFNAYPQPQVPQPQVTDPQQQGQPPPPQQQPAAYPGATASPGAPTAPFTGSTRPGEIVRPPVSVPGQPGLPTPGPPSPEGN